LGSGFLFTEGALMRHVSNRFQIETLEERIAPTANLNPGENNTNNTGNQPSDGGGGSASNNNPGENNTNNPGNETP
jgi:hypothetical protein